MAGASLCTWAQSLPGLPSLGSKSASPATSAGAEPTLADWTARLEQARAQYQRLSAQPPDSAPLLAQRQMASSRLVVLLAARVDALRSKAAARSATAGPATRTPTLEGEPPFDVLAVDALRDQLDLWQTQRSTYEQQLKSLDRTIEESITNRDHAEAHLRLRREQAAVARPDAADEARAQVELADMLAEVASLEVIQNDELRRETRERLAALAAPIDAARSELARVGLKQRFDEASLAKVLKDISARRQAVSAESRRLTERLARAESIAPGDEALRQRVVQPLQRAIRILSDVDALEGGQENLWRGRREAISGSVDRARRRVAEERISDLIDELQPQRQRLIEEERVVRHQLRLQRALLAELATGDRRHAAEQQALDALQAQADAQDRLADTIERTLLLAGRTQADLAGSGSPTNTTEWLQHAWSRTVDALAAIWQYELFSATETSLIEGRTVTVEHGVTVGKSIGALLLLVIGYWAAGKLSHLLVRAIGRSVPLTPQLGRVLRRWINSILLVAVVLLVLKVARIPLTAFAFLGGALAIGIGFGAQNVIKNLISGVIILFERKIHVGDVIAIGGMLGTVTNVDLRATTVRGFDGIDAIVPNSNLLENQVSNWSGGSPDVRRTIAVGVAYGSDVGQAAQVILRCAQGNPHVLPQPPADVLFEDFGADALVLRLRYWTRLDGPRGGSGVDSDLRFAIHDALKEAGIEIAFPQRDVHLDVPGTLRVELGAAAPPPPAASS